LIHFEYFVALAAISGAPDELPADEEAIEEIAVLATRRAVNLGDLSSAISTTGRNAVLDGKLVTDALADVAGVTLQQTTPGQGAAIVRGLKGSAILHLVDGMRLNNAMFRTAPTPWFALVPTTSVERVEVVRGTPASLYGSDAVGGVIQSVSRLPEFDTDTMGYGGDIIVGLDSAELQQSIRATLDAGTRQLAGSVSAEYLATGNRRVGGGDRIGPSDYSSRAVRAVLHGSPTATRSWFVDLHFLEQPETPRVDELVPGFGQTEPSSSEFFFAPNRRTFVHFQHEHLTDAGIDWRVDAAWQRIDDDRRTRDFDAPARRYEENRSDLFGLTINASGHYAAIDWIAGLDLYHDEVQSARYEEDIATGATTPLAARFPDGSTIGQAGIFVKLDWRTGERHRWSAGLRYTDVGIELPDGTRIDPGSLSGDLGWIFDINDQWQLVANVGNGFRAPNIADIGTLGNRPGNRFNVPNTDLDAETVVHVDMGVRYHAAHWHAELVAYRLDYDDRIVSVGTGDTTPEGRDIVRSVNAAASTLQGIEAGLYASLSDRLDFTTTVNYTYGVQRVGQTEEPADRVPPLQVRLALEFEQSSTWTFNTWLTGADRQDRLSARDVRDVRIDPEGTAGWLVLGASATRTSADGWQLVAGIDNILDTNYRVHGSGLDAPGRNFSLTMRRTW
jgi:outer membrane receptor protein involved in Fe transport